MADFISQLSGPEMDNALQEVNAHNAEAWSSGTRGGVQVGSGDPTYDNNAKYWAGVAKSAVPAGSNAAVLWNQPQTLSEANKATARANIGASGVVPIVNLLNPTLGTISYSGTLTVTNNGDGTYTFNGTPASNTWVTLTPTRQPLNGGTYKVLGVKNLSDVSACYAQFYDSGGTNISNDVNSGQVFSSNNIASVSFTVVCYPSKTLNNVIVKPMIVDATQFGSATYDDFIEYGHYTQPIVNYKHLGITSQTTESTVTFTEPLNEYSFLYITCQYQGKSVVSRLIPVSLIRDNLINAETIQGGNFTVTVTNITLTNCKATSVSGIGIVFYGIK